MDCTRGEVDVQKCRAKQHSHRERRLLGQVEIEGEREENTRKEIKEARCRELISYIGVNLENQIVSKSTMIFFSNSPDIMGIKLAIKLNQLFHNEEQL